LQGKEAAVVSSPPSYEVCINALRTIFGKRTIIFGEDPARYDQLLALVAADVRPQTMREWLVVKDIVDAQWEFWRIRGFKAGVLNAVLPYVIIRQIADATGKEVTYKQKQIMREQLLRVLTDKTGARETFAALLAEYQLTMDGIATAAFQPQMQLQLELDKQADAAHDRRNAAYAELELLQERSSSRSGAATFPGSPQNMRHIEAPGSIAPADPADAPPHVAPDRSPAETGDAEPVGESSAPVVDDQRP
jgi:hypothetical protein